MAQSSRAKAGQGLVLYCKGQSKDKQSLAEYSNGMALYSFVR